MNEKAEVFIRNEWLPALRSGDYRKSVGVLKHRETGNTCALGVLCDRLVIAGRGEWQDPGEDEEGMKFIYDDFEHYDAEIVLPETLAAEFEIDYQLGFAPKIQITENMSAENVAQLNDMGWSFDQIADFVEATLDGTSGHEFIEV